MAIENKEIAEVIGRYIAAVNAGDMRAAAQLDGDVGFGSRTAAWRGRLDTDTNAALLKKWWDSMEYYHCEMEELNTSSEDNIGLAWGFYVEKLKVKGQPDEQVRVRFSAVFKKVDQRWKFIMYHRDIQPFDKDGRYISQVYKG